MATREQTPLTWLSALAFFLIGITCYSTYYRVKKKIWYFLAMLFFFFSMDDATYFHERISGWLVDESSLFSIFPSYTWVLLYFPLMLFGLGALLHILYKSPHISRKKLFAAFGLLTIAIIFDLVDGAVLKNDNLTFCLNTFCDNSVTHLIRLTEEVCEVFALGALGWLLVVDNYYRKD